MTVKKTNDDLKGLRIILVGSHTEVQNHLADQLRKLGCQVKTAASYEETRALLVRGQLTNSPYRAVIVYLDRVLPNGNEFLRSFLREEKTNNIKIIAMMSKANYESFDYGSYQGVINILEDPVQLRDLISVITDSAIYADNEEGKSTFARKMRTGDSYRHPPLKILIVEDDELILKMDTILFQQLGYDIDTAIGGMEALIKLESEIFDLTFMDLQMPNMSGIDTAKRIRALDNKNKDIPIIAMTGFDSDKYKQLAKEAGMNDFISKPFSINRISQILESFASRVEQSETFRTKDLDHPAKSNEEPIIDPSVGMTVFHNDLVEYRKFITLFIKEFSDRWEKLNSASNLNDWEFLENEAHNLKGISANLGAKKISAIASMLESLSEKGDDSSIKSTLVELKGALSEFELKVRNMIG